MEMDKRVFLLFLGFLGAWLGFAGLVSLGFWAASGGLQTNLVASAVNITRTVAQAINGDTELKNLLDRLLDGKNVTKN